MARWIGKFAKLDWRLDPRERPHWSSTFTDPQGKYWILTKESIHDKILTIKILCKWEYLFRDCFAGILNSGTLSCHRKENRKIKTLPWLNEFFNFQLDPTFNHSTFILDVQLDAFEADGYTVSQSLQSKVNPAYLEAFHPDELYDRGEKEMKDKEIKIYGH